MTHNNGGIYAVIDNKAQAIVGYLMIFRHVAAAIRYFTDIAAKSSKGNTMVSEHPEDFDLYLLGYLDTNNEVVKHHELVMAGAAWAATRDHTTTDLENNN